MKIEINYDLFDKALQARKGFSLKEHSKDVGLCMAMASPVIIIDAVTKSPLEAASRSAFLLFYYSIIFGLTQKARKSTMKDKAVNDLTQLSDILSSIFADTNAELLQEAECYKTKYSLILDGKLPRIEEKKYLHIPTINDFGTDTRSLVQEHFFGSKEYYLSCETEEEEKVYSLGDRKITK